MCDVHVVPSRRTKTPRIRSKRLRDYDSGKRKMGSIAYVEDLILYFREGVARDRLCLGSADRVLQGAAEGWMTRGNVVRIDCDVVMK